ncbi:MAG TPA: hypothetical protein VEA78_13195 [Acidimicrobiales bacterium]|nr:hypothetical protein [Acidimicrobiales bacterium]
MGLLFKRAFHDALADGSLTETTREWKRPQVKVGGVYRIGGTEIALQVDSLARLDDGRWHVRFHRVDPPRPQPTLTVEEILTKLDRMNARSAGGPWTHATLRIIGQQPGVVSTKLAEQLGRERFALKADIRKLKALGLTESLEVGYRLTAPGVAVDGSR